MLNEKRLVESFMEYVKIDSPSGYEKDFALFLDKELKALGFEVFIDATMEQTGCNTGNVSAILKGTCGRPVLFSCHMDTVNPGRGIEPVLDGDTIRTSGPTILGADDKAAIAALIEAVRVIKENNIPHGDIEISFTVAEEIGIVGAKATDYSLFASEYCYVLDTGGAPGKIAVQGPSHNVIYAQITGKASHAGTAPEKGISAIMVAADAISNMKLLRIDEETTANIGTIEGGLGTNIVAEEVHIKGEARSLNEDKLQAQTDHMIKCFKDAADKFGASVRVEVASEYKAFRISEDDPIVKNGVKAIESAGITPQTIVVGGGSDGNVINSDTRIKAVTLSNGGSNAHSEEESIKIQELLDTSRIVMELIKVYAGL